jgi:nitrogen regulatory protein P-II 1
MSSADAGVSLLTRRASEQAAAEAKEPRDRSGRGAFFLGPGRGAGFVKVEAVVVRERVETVIDAVEEETGHVGVTVVEAIGHGRERGVTHEYRGRTFESRFLPKALLTFVVADEHAERVVAAIADAARTGHPSGDGLCWASPVSNVVHHRTGERL